MQTIHLKSSPTSHLNPFGGYHEEELPSWFVESEDTEQLLDAIQTGNVRTLAIIGRKGRGKTTLLKYLHSQIEESAIVLIKPGKPYVIPREVKVLFVDGIYNLNYKQRLEIWRLKCLVIYVCHRNIYQPEVKLLRKGKFHKKKVKGLTMERLKSVVENRLNWIGELENPLFAEFRGESFLQDKLKKHKDDLRAIMYDLYRQTNKLNKQLNE